MNRIFTTLALITLVFAGAGRWPARLCAATQAGAKTTATKYQCPMHPQIIRDKPGDCPICGMHLQAVDMDEHQDPGAPGAVPGKGAFELSEARQQMIGVRVAVAKTQALSKTLRLAGRVSGGGVLAQLLEMDAGALKAGLKVELVGPDGSTAKALVGAVEGSLDSVTRSFGVLISPLESRAWMKNGVFTEARVELPLGKGLAIPEEAVLDTGERNVAFVRKGTRFEPRAVTLGAAGSGLVIVKSGIREGEEVLSSANFLIDSESRFRAAAQVQP